MKDWTKVGAFEKIYRAEIRKDLLQENGIKAIVLNQKDSAFLLGDIELFVENEHYEKAEALLSEFDGWIKIDSFIQKTQIDRLQEKLNEQNIETKIIKHRPDNSLYSFFELFVQSAQIEQAKQIIGNFSDWIKLAKYRNAIQAFYRTERLEQKNIPTLVINDRDENGVLVNVNVYVQDSDLKSAIEIIHDHSGWLKADELKNLPKAHLIESALENENVEALEEIVLSEDDSIESITIFVPENKIEDAKSIIESQRTFKSVLSDVKMYQVELFMDLLQSYDINCTLIKHKDSSFLLGEFEVYVDSEDFDRAIELIEEFKTKNPDNNSPE